MIGFEQMSWHIIPRFTSLQINLKLFLKKSQTTAAKRVIFHKNTVSLTEYVFLESPWKLVLWCGSEEEDV